MDASALLRKGELRKTTGCEHSMDDIVHWKRERVQPVFSFWGLTKGVMMHIMRTDVRIL